MALWFFPFYFEKGFSHINSPVFFFDFFSFTFWAPNTILWESPSCTFVARSICKTLVLPRIIYGST